MEEQKKITMEVVNPYAAGIDIGSRSHWVAVGQGAGDIKEFGVYNEDLFSIAAWLKQLNYTATEKEELCSNLNAIIQKKIQDK